MPDDLEYIERFFEGNFSPEELHALEERIVKEPALAEAMAFYVGTLRIGRPGGQSKERFRRIFDENPQGTSGQLPVTRRLWPYTAAASVACIVILLSIFYSPPSPAKLADQYIESHLQSLPVKMDNRQSNFKTAARLYNEGKLSEALMHFENIIRNDSSNFSAKENAGIVSLRLKNYDKALQYFKEVENYAGLYANPGKFYRALTLLKRNRPGDAGQAKGLLREVARDHLDHDKEAQEMLERL